MTRYEPANSCETPRFSGVRTFMRLPNSQDLENSDAAVVGAPFDTATTFRVGARFGPEGIRSVSHLLRPYNPSQDIAIFDHLSVIDYGDVPVVPGYVEESYRRIAEGLEPIHRAGVVPIVLGGDHSIQVGMRGSIYEAGDWEDAREMGFDLVPTDAIRKLGIEETIARIRERVGDARVYVSFDVDFVDPAFAPGTGTPEIGGFTSREAQEFVRGLVGVDIVGCDVVEVLPPYDGPGQVTALLAANVAHEFISLFALGRKNGG